MPAGFAPIAIGLALTLIHLISIPVTNTSVNPARSTAVAFVATSGGPSLLWLFWVATLIGGAVGEMIWKLLLEPVNTVETNSVEVPPAPLAATP